MSDFNEEDGGKAKNPEWYDLACVFIRRFTIACAVVADPTDLKQSISGDEDIALDTFLTALIELSQSDTLGVGVTAELERFFAEKSDKLEAQIKEVVLAKTAEALVDVLKDAGSENSDV